MTLCQSKGIFLPKKVYLFYASVLRFVCIRLPGDELFNPSLKTHWETNGSLEMLLDTVGCLNV